MGAPIFLPKIVTCLRDYSREQFLRDLIAGTTVGVVALPLALAFGIASIPLEAAEEAGLSPPAMGLYTAIVAGFIISLLGGSRASIGGPTGAFVVIVFAIASEHGYSGLVLATMMAGVILVFFGLARLGGLIKYIPYPVVTGFTAGIAVVILGSQIKDLLGIRALSADDVMPVTFIARLSWLGSHASTVHWQTAIVGILSAVTIFCWPRSWRRRVPAPIVVLVGATALAQLLNIPIETIGERFGAMPRGLPAPHLPTLDLGRMPELLIPALTIAVLASVESLLCAVVIDGMISGRHRSNTELIAQGVANIASPMFGGIPATGAIARSATNVQAGGRTPVAGIVHALVLLAIVVALGRYASMVPLCVLAGVLVNVAWNMAEIDRFRWLLRGPRSDALVLLATFSLTILTDLTIAVQVGIVLAALLFIKRMADLTNVTDIRESMSDTSDDTPLQDTLPPFREGHRGIEIYDINGPFFFGAAFKLRETLDSIETPPRALILDLSRVPAVDASGLHALDEMYRRCRRDRTALFLSGVGRQPRQALAGAGLLDSIGPGRLLATIPDAVRAAEQFIAAETAHNADSRTSTGAHSAS